VQKRKKRDERNVPKDFKGTLGIPLERRKGKEKEEHGAGFAGRSNVENNGTIPFFKKKEGWREVADRMNRESRGRRNPRTNWV